MLLHWVRLEFAADEGTFDRLLVFIFVFEFKIWLVPTGINLILIHPFDGYDLFDLLDLLCNNS